MASDVLFPPTEDHMLSGVNFLLIGTVAVLLVLYLLRRRTRIVISRIGAGSGTDAESAGIQ